VVNRFRWVALVGGVTLLAAGCGDGAAEGPPGEATRGRVSLTVYFQGALTGDYNYLVIHGFQAAKLRFQELNADPTFPAEVTLEEADTQGDPEQAPSVVETVVSDPTAVAVVGPAFSGESEASGDTYDEAGIPFATPAATNPGLADQGWEYWYRAVANDEDQGTPVAEWIAGQGYGSVFVVHDVSTYGQGLADVVRRVLEEQGAEVAAFQGIEPTEDYSALITDVEASGAEAMFYGGYDAQAGLLVGQARDAGLDIPIYSGDGSVSSTFLDLAGDAVRDVFLSCPCNLEGAAGFLSTYEAEYGETGVPIYAAEAYDVASMIGEGIRSAVESGAREPEQIRQGIKEYLDSLTTDSPFEGAAKTYAFDDTHELAAEDRRALIFFYQAAPKEISLLGNAAEILAG
jgi:branched-chain amino acid transport system substrate-binding protein